MPIVRNWHKNSSWYKTKKIAKFQFQSHSFEKYACPTHGVLLGKYQFYQYNVTYLHILGVKEFGNATYQACVVLPDVISHLFFLFLECGHVFCFNYWFDFRKGGLLLFVLVAIVILYKNSTSKIPNSLIFCRLLAQNQLQWF